MAGWVKPQAGALTTPAAEMCAGYILVWLRTRNGGEFSEALDAQRVGDERRMRAELVAILEAGGKPDNWT